MKQLIFNIKQFLIFAPLLFIIGCSQDIEIDQGEYEKRLVIEAYIENDAYAWGVLTYNQAYFEEIDLSNFTDFSQWKEIFISDAVIVVSDGEVFDTLQFELDSLVLQNQMVWPPVRFVGKKIKGEVGKSYTLKVIHEEKTYTATTSIPTPYHADTLWFKVEPGKDNLGFIHTRIHDNPNETNYYRYYTKRIGRDFYYTPSIMSIWDDRIFNGQNFEFVLWRGNGIEEDYGYEDSEETYFRIGDTVSIKSCMMDHDTFWFWQTLGSRETLSNIKGGALGVWCGYGVAYHTFVCQ